MGHTTARQTEHRAEAALARPLRPAMRLLVTNPWNGQAYCVLRTLRPHAARVIVTTYREHGVLGRLAPAAVSRFADAVYRVPFAAQDWQRGQISDENSEAEEAYVRAVLDICAREDVDTVFPSWDPEVGILSKNKLRFAERGITLSVPEWSVLRQVAPRRDDELLGTPPPLRGIVRGYRDTYLAPGRFFDWYFKALADDPLAGLAWYTSHLIRIRGGRSACRAE